MKSKILAQQIVDLVTRYSVEIGLQTYFRKPHEMNQTPQWWKLQRSEALTRELRHKVQTLGDDLLKEIERNDSKLS